MALGQTADMKTMDVAYMGNPFAFVNVPAESDSKTIDIAYMGNPFVVIYSIASVSDSSLLMWFMRS